MPQIMKVCKLSDIAEVQTGPFGSQLHSEDYVEEGTPIVTVEHLGNRRFTIQNLPFVSNEDRERLSKYSLREGDIVFSRVGAVDRCSYVTSDENGWLFSGRCLRVRCHHECDALYLYYYFCSNSVKEYVRSKAVGATMLSLNTDLMLEIPIQFPQIKLQKEIAKTLSFLDSKIELNRQINDNLEAMAKQLYDYWFVQFDFPNEEGKPYKSSGGAMVYNEKMKREIPQGWSNGVLSDVANITMGQSPDGSSYNEDGEGIIFYQGSTDFGLRFPDIRQYTTSPSRYANKGDILMSVRAPVGALNIANNDCCIGRGLSALSSKIGSMTHLYYLMNDFRLKFEGMNSAGTTFGAITKDELFSIPVIIPTKSVISEFEQVCEPIFDKQMIIGEEINALTKQRDELLPLLMNGQASVNYHLS